MANMFALILAIATLLTGIIWCFERFKWGPARQAKIAAVNAQTAEIKAQTGCAVDNKTLAQAAKQPVGSRHVPLSSRCWPWSLSCVRLFTSLSRSLLVR